MAFTIPFKEMVELTEIFFASALFAKLTNTLQNSFINIIYEEKEIKPE
jgi:hypothetical protein